MKAARSMESKRKFDAVIFDIDNVIVDTRFSYTDCIRETVQIYLEQILKFKPAGNFLLSRQDVECFKLLGGFNDDWDTCYGFLLYLMSLKTKVQTIRALKQQVDLKKFSKKLKGPGSVNTVEQICGRHKKISLSRVAQIFQKLYWSKYIRRESIVLQRRMFAALHSRGFKLGIATGRNRREAFFVLKSFGVAPFIQRVVGIDDLPGKAFKKPHPFSLFALAKSFGKNLRYLYIGDLPDDMRMAKQAGKQMNVTGWGFSALSSSRREMNRALKRSGASRVIKTASELNRLLQNL